MQSFYNHTIDIPEEKAFLYPYKHCSHATCHTDSHCLSMIKDKPSMATVRRIQTPLTSHKQDAEAHFF